MRTKMVFILGVAVLIGLAGWFGFREAALKPENAEAAKLYPGGASQPISDTDSPGQRLPPATVGEFPAEAHATAPSGGELLHEWLTSSQDVDEIAEAILRGWPKLKTDDQAMVAKELIPLVADDRYQGLRKLLLDPNTSSEAKELIFKNLILRPKDLHLPLFLAVLQQSPRHPCAEDARNLLMIRLGADYGTDWAKWQARINEELRP